MESELFLDFGNKKLSNHLKRVKKSKRPVCLFKINKDWFKYNRKFSHLFDIHRKLDRYLIPNLVKTLKQIVLEKTLKSQSGSASMQCVFLTKNGIKIRFQCWCIPLRFKEGRGIQCIFREMKNQDFDDFKNTDQTSFYGSQVDKMTTINNGEYNLSTEGSSSSFNFVDSEDDLTFEKNAVLTSTSDEKNNIQPNNCFRGETQNKPDGFINYSRAVQILSQNILENSENESKISGSLNKSKNKGFVNNSKSSSSEKQVVKQNELAREPKQRPQKKNNKKIIKLKKMKGVDQRTVENKKRHLKKNKKNNSSLNKNQKNKPSQEKDCEQNILNNLLKDETTNQQINFEILSIKEFFQFCIQYINIYTNQMELNYNPKDEVLSDLQKINSIFINSLAEKIKYIENLHTQLQIEKKNTEDNYQKMNNHYQKRLQEFKTKQQNCKTNQILKSQLLIFKQIISKLLKNGTDIQQMVTNLN
ncbi:hypothetical protein M0813_05676 [Anaeramoeba flamelloides]|uniref:Uncharacterized protein n=1 Tax=Anaeramoeba flamelloides TaxID=1746091 RepID=A0ABQ8XIT4_9EUKA|nr:hypothetical protein M0813_05676 [Anaeramoeba flamelloides]